MKAEKTLFVRGWPAYFGSYIEFYNPEKGEDIIISCEGKITLLPGRRKRTMDWWDGEDYPLDCFFNLEREAIIETFRSFPSEELAVVSGIITIPTKKEKMNRPVGGRDRYRELPGNFEVLDFCKAPFEGKASPFSAEFTFGGRNEFARPTRASR